MAKAVHFYARKRRPPIPHARFAHSMRRTCGLVADRDDDSIDVIAAPTPPADQTVKVVHPV